MQCTSYHNFLHKKNPYLHALQGNGEMGARYLDPKYSRWISTDPALGEYIPAAGKGNSENAGNLPGMGGIYNHINGDLYHYAGNNPIRYIDPDGRLQRDASGNLIFDFIYKDVKTIGNGIGYTFAAEFGYLYADDGTKIFAWKNLSPDVPQANTNCFGLTFADGEYWIEDDVQKILDGDGYVQISESDIIVGDIEIYKNHVLGIIHADTVSSINERKFLFIKWKDVMVRTLSGTETTPYDACLHDGPTPDVKIFCQSPELYYRKPMEEN